MLAQEFGVTEFQSKNLFVKISLKHEVETKKTETFDDATKGKTKPKTKDRKSIFYNGD